MMVMDGLMVASSWFHTLNPEVLRVGSGLAVRWYGLAYVAGFVVAWLVVKKMSRAGMCKVPAARVGDFMFAVLLGVIAGGRLGYVLFYKPALLWDFHGQFPWWGTLEINKGGMSAHGGMAGVILGAMYFAWRHKISPLNLFDTAALASPFGLFFGRLANFVNGELLGFPVKDQANAPWWSVKFPQEIRDWGLGQLGQLSDVVTKAGESGLEFSAAVGEAQRGSAEAQSQVAGAVERVIEATQAGNAGVIEALRPMLVARWPSQLIQAVTDGPVLLLVLALVWWRPRKEGVVGSWFLMVYGAMRIVTETWRMPDAGVELIAGISRGRFYSVLMIAAGAVLMWWCARRDAEKVRGIGGAR